jgi:hypothetical protein
MRHSLVDPRLLTRDTRRHTYHVVTQASSPSDNDNAAPTSVVVAQAGERETPRESKVGRKERVLHTRVPAVLERELKRFAENLRIPVSNLVRTILEDALSVADLATESVEERLKRAAHHLEKEREKLKKRMEHDPLEGIMAFQAVTLALESSCAKCERDLPRGSRAHMGIRRADRPERGGGPLFVCDGCLPTP